MSSFTPINAPFVPKVPLTKEAEEPEKYLESSHQQHEFDETIGGLPRPERRFDPQPFARLPGGISFTSCGILGIQSIVDLAAVKASTLFSSIVVEVHGSVRFPKSLQAKRDPKSDQLPEMELAYGVYFGPGSNHNRGGVISDIVWKDKQAAYLHAAIIALKKICKLLNPDVPPKLYSDVQHPDPEYVEHAFRLLHSAKKNTKLIVIKSDSKYPVYLLNKNIYDWLVKAKDEGLDKHGEPLIKELHDRLIGLEKRGIVVQFRGVHSKEICVAKDLAEKALDQAEAGREGIQK